MALDEGRAAAGMSSFSVQDLGRRASLLRRGLRIKSCIGDPIQ